MNGHFVSINITLKKQSIVTEEHPLAQVLRRNYNLRVFRIYIYIFFTNIYLKA